MITLESGKTGTLKPPKSDLEAEIGLLWPVYSMVKGAAKERPEDFIVEEITPSGELMDADKATGSAAVDSLEKPQGCDNLHLRLVKYDWDNALALKKIARHLRVSMKSVGFAGTKDKRALTAQRISVYGPDPELVKSFNEKDLWLFPLKWEGERVKLGDLKGNRFTITLRGIKGEETEVREALESALSECETVGAPNFFGFQRFGSRLNTHLVGRKIIDGDLKAAVFEYLCGTSSLEGPSRAIREKVRAHLEENDYAAAIGECPKSWKHELAILHSLANDYRDYAKALRALPPKVLLLCVHAYQSWLFNKALSAFLHSFNGDLKQLEGKSLKLDPIEVKRLPHLSLKGEQRQALVKAEGAKVLDVSRDEKHKDSLKATVQFTLPKGSYATLVLKRITGELSA